MTAAECAETEKVSAPEAPVVNLVWVERGWRGEVMHHPCGAWAELESWCWTVHSPRDPVPSMRMVRGYITGRPPGSIECARRNAKSALIHAAYRLKRALVHEVAELRARLNKQQDPATDPATAVAEIDAMSQEQMETELRKHGVDPVAPVAVQIEQVRALHAARGWS